MELDREKRKSMVEEVLRENPEIVISVLKEEPEILRKVVLEVLPPNVATKDDIFLSLHW